VLPFARALIWANGDRVQWDTDWPRPQLTDTPGGRPSDVNAAIQIDDGQLINQLAVWAPDAATRKKILIDNPAQLYQF
jgi:predicted TIM-barrel fold metal-dependent hydrolase